MMERAYLLHAFSPLHAGVGHAADIIDLPIARMKATGIPFVPGSSVKGVLRDTRWAPGDDSKLFATFGPPSTSAGDHAGALVVGDARLLALPVRSFRGTFAWVTSPLLLSLAKRDLGCNLNVPSLDERKALVTSKECCTQGGKLYLEDLDLAIDPTNSDIEDWADEFAPIVSPSGTDIFTRRFVIVDDDTMTFLWETSTQIDTRVQISPETRTVKRGALWLEESLPPETLLIGLMGADRSRRTGADGKLVQMQPKDVMDFAFPRPEVLQFGGKATVGRGRCLLTLLPEAMPIPSATREVASDAAE